jgi:hypothetical protein
MWGSTSFTISNLENDTSYHIVLPKGWDNQSGNYLKRKNIKYKIVSFTTLTTTVRRFETITVIVKNMGQFSVTWTVSVPFFFFVNTISQIHKI